VVGKGSQRIQYDFRLHGVRYRPTLRAIPTEANLRRAREHLKVIRGRIRLSTFSFIEEFPDFRDLHQVFQHSPHRTCDQVFDEYLSYCDSRLSKHDLSFATVTGYRKVLGSIWRPKLGAFPFLQVRYSTLLKIASQYKTCQSPRLGSTASIRTRPRLMRTVLSSFVLARSRSSHVNLHSIVT
jgi:hypothetical protein